MAFDLSRIVRIAQERMAQTISEDLFRDMDPLNTEWAIAVRTAMQHYRKRRRRFFSLWLDELHKARFKGGFEGLTAVIRGSTTYSGGEKINVPFEFR